MVRVMNKKEAIAFLDKNAVRSEGTYETILSIYDDNDEIPESFIKLYLQPREVSEPKMYCGIDTKKMLDEEVKDGMIASALYNKRVKWGVQNTNKQPKKKKRKKR